MSLSLSPREAHDVLLDEEVDQCVVISDPFRPDCPILFVSDEFTVQTGYGAEDAVGRNCRFLQGRDTDLTDRRAIRLALAEELTFTIDILNYRRDDSPF